MEKSETGKKPTPREMIEWLEAQFDCDDPRNDLGILEWGMHIRDFIKEHSEVP